MSVVTLAVDAMGGDHGLSVTVPAVAKMLSRHAHLNIILVGQAEPLAEAVQKAGLSGHVRIRLQKILPKEDFVGTVTGTCGQ